MSEPPDPGWRTEPDDATPLTDDEQDGLKPSWIATRADLNAAETQNITKALTARRWRTLPAGDLLDDHMLRRLHKAMYGDVWNWAGEYRRTEKNIGCDPRYIAVKVRDLCEDAKYWFADPAVALDEAACRFHHALVAIHPFPNGNGRHARAVTDLLLAAAGAQPFSWGQASLLTPGETRSRYIRALRAADAGDLQLLLDFARS